MNFKPASLAQLFEPPEGYRGIFGWLCGYSADAGFLDDAIERFSGLTGAQRSYQGNISLAVMLDPGNPQILPAAVPGMLHLPIKSRDFPFRLLHAKVALLGFDGPDRSLLRIIITTGNWTRQTLEESLDLAWHIDIASNGDRTSERVRQDQTDLAAVWSFLSWVGSLFDTRALDMAENGNNDSATAAKKIAAWADELGKAHRGYRPRFFDNRASSLFRQLPDLVRAHAGDSARNYLALGSGFYESAHSGTPNVPESIFAQLRKADLLTSTCEKNIFVNPFACQSIATGRASIEEQGWTIRCAESPSYFGTVPRSLHAKFIFSASERTNSNNCGSPWVYLGSGNLTGPGFNHKAGSLGNLEAGVVLAPEHLTWEEDRDGEAECLVTSLLPIHWNDEGDVLPTLQAGEDMPEREVTFTAAPIGLFLWQETSEGSRLVPQGTATCAFHVIGPDGNPCELLQDGMVVWDAQRPRLVTLSWQGEDQGHEAAVPVIDIYGRFCAAEFPSLDLEQAWTQLANFPMPPDDEELIDGDAQTSVDGTTAATSATQAPTSVYPVRRMMALLEDIAAKQAEIAQNDWSTWCNRLEQVLIQSKDSSDVKAFHAIGMNPLYPLLQATFRPAFASTDDTIEGARYVTALHRVTEAWNLEGQTPLGGQS
jgi:hypothetical protein